MVVKILVVKSLQKHFRGILNIFNCHFLHFTAEESDTVQCREVGELLNSGLNPTTKKASVLLSDGRSRNVTQHHVQIIRMTFMTTFISDNTDAS